MKWNADGQRICIVYENGMCYLVLGKNYFTVNMRLMYAYELPMNSLFTRMTAIDKINYFATRHLHLYYDSIKSKLSVQEELFVRGDMQETTDNVLLINSHFYKLRCWMTQLLHINNC